MGLPSSVTVEVAFTTDPLAAVPTWTDITAYVDLSEQVTIRRGRSSETDQPQPGTLSLTLDNNDGRFTPGRVASPYYPNVTINRRIRVSAVHSGVTYRLFDGHVDAWPVEWENGVRPFVPITATDRLKFLARRPMGALYDEQSLALEPTGYFPLAEDAGSRSVRDMVLGGSPAPVVASKYGPGLVVFSGRDAEPGQIANVNIDSDDFGAYGPVPLSYLRLDGTPGRFYEPSAYFTISLWFTAGTLPAGWDSVLYDHHHNADPRSMKLRILPSGQIEFEVYGSGPLDYFATQFGNVQDNDWHHVVIKRGPNLLQHYLDGQVAAEYNPTSAFGESVWATMSGLNRLHLGATIRERTGAVGVSGGGYRGSLARLGLFDRALTAAEILDLNEIGVPFGRERSDLRAQRLAAIGGLSTTAITDVGQSEISNAQNTVGQGADTAFLDVAASEGGVFFINGAGDPVLQSRAARINQAPSFSLAAADLDADLRFALSDALMVNDITVGRPGAGDVRVSDAASKAKHGTYGEQATTLLATGPDARHYGEWQVERRSTPKVRAETVGVDPFTNTALYDKALGTELGTEFTVTGLPATAPVSSLALVIEGLTHTFSVNGWRTAWDTSQADDTDYLQWGLTWGARVWAW